MKKMELASSLGSSMERILLVSCESSLVKRDFFFKKKSELLTSIANWFLTVGVCVIDCSSIGKGHR